MSTQNRSISPMSRGASALPAVLDALQQGLPVTTASTWTLSPPTSVSVSAPPMQRLSYAAGPSRNAISTPVPCTLSSSVLEMRGLEPTASSPVSPMLASRTVDWWPAYLEARYAEARQNIIPAPPPDASPSSISRMLGPKTTEPQPVSDLEGSNTRRISTESAGVDLLAAEIVSAIMVELRGLVSAVREEIISSKAEVLDAIKEVGTTFEASGTHRLRAPSRLHEHEHEHPGSTPSPSVPSPTHSEGRRINRRHSTYSAGTPHASRDHSISAPAAHSAASSHSAPSTSGLTIRRDGFAGKWVAITPTRLKFAPRKYRAKRRGSHTPHPGDHTPHAELVVETEQTGAAFEDEMYANRFVDDVLREYSKLEKPDALHLNVVMPGPKAALDAADHEHERWAHDLKEGRMALLRSLFVSKGADPDKLFLLFEDGELAIHVDM